MLQTNNNSGGKTILVAGGAGFLGSHLCERLLGQGNRVICVDNYLSGTKANLAHLRNHPSFSAVEQDICTKFAVGEPLDQIYNLACPASPPRYQTDPVHTLMTSVGGANNLLQMAAEHGAAFLQASTSEVYGDPEEHPQRESYWGHVNCTGPRACYDEGKRAAETLCFDRLRRGEVDARVARIFNTYGPRMQPDDGRIISNFVVQALRGEPLTIYGSGEQTRSFCYVDDLVRGLIALMNVDPNPHQPVNLGNPGEFTVNALAEQVAALTGAGGGVVKRPLPVDDPRCRRPVIDRAAALLGWKPEVALSEGLALTVAWFRDNLTPARPHRKEAGHDVTAQLVAKAEHR
ncbi:MAG: UDP-glucuronic acid decarboxylase family protein [Martelella sp.]|uniref:UDP-glucuronic acid decarboxylase family protein n=1 Tax=Martelella sp. TaxID=1969699 RepID=UPI0032429356